MYYEIIVALNGKHFFATAERSVTTSWELERVLAVFREKFPATEGYNIIVTKWSKIGEEINI